MKAKDDLRDRRRCPCGRRFIVATATKANEADGIGDPQDECAECMGIPLSDLRELSTVAH